MFLRLFFLPNSEFDQEGAELLLIHSRSGEFEERSELGMTVPHFRKHGSAGSRRGGELSLPDGIQNTRILQEKTGKSNAGASGFPNHALRVICGAKITIADERNMMSRFDRFCKPLQTIGNRKVSLRNGPVMKHDEFRVFDRRDPIRQRRIRIEACAQLAAEGHACGHRFSDY